MAKRGYGRKIISVPGKYVFLILTILCVAMMLLSFTTDFITGPFETVAGYVIVPFQKGISKVGAAFVALSEERRSKLFETQPRIRHQR